MQQDVNRLIKVYSKRQDNLGAESLIMPEQFNPETMAKTKEELETIVIKKGQNVSNT